MLLSRELQPCEELLLAAASSTALGEGMRLRSTRAIFHACCTFHDKERSWRERLLERYFPFYGLYDPDPDYDAENQLAEEE